MKLFHTALYLPYLILAGHRNGHGIHSPFIYDLVSRIFRNKTAGDVVCIIEMIRKKLIRDKNKINVCDLGTGNNKKSIRKVSQITRNSAIPKKYGVLLSNLASEFGKSSVLELGTSFGISTMYMAAACPGSVVYTIEGCKETAEIARGNFVTAGLTNVELINRPFDEVLPELIEKGLKPGFVFIDGNHRKEPVLRYFGMLLKTAGDDTVFVFDDIHDSSEMNEAWNIIKNHESVSATVDIFRMGIVFLRKGLTHNDYIVRY